MHRSKLIILDRDGVINHDSGTFIKSPEEWIPIAGSLEAIARLCRENYRVVVITNQSGISRGLLTVNTLNRIHQKMLNQLGHVGGEISAIFFCPHSAVDKCSCRKPKPGMFRELSGRLNCNLSEVYAVGDSLRDLQAAHAAGAKPVLVKTGKGTTTLQKLKPGDSEHNFEAVPVYPDLAGFVQDIFRVSNHHTTPKE